MILVFDGTIIELISAIALFGEKGEDETVKFIAKTFNIYAVDETTMMDVEIAALEELENGTKIHQKGD